MAYSLAYFLSRSLVSDVDLLLLSSDTASSLSFISKTCLSSTTSLDKVLFLCKFLLTFQLNFRVGLLEIYSSPLALP